MRGRAVRSSVGQDLADRLGLLGLRQRRQPFHVMGQVGQERVRVDVHRQPDAVMTGKGLGVLGVNARLGQVADERVSQRVEVGETARSVDVLEEAG